MSLLAGCAPPCEGGNAAALEAISALSAAVRALREDDTRSASVAAGDVEQAADWFSGAVKRFLPEGTATPAPPAPTSAPLTGVSDQPTLQYTTSLLRFIRGACPYQPTAQAAALAHPALPLAWAAASCPKLLHTGGEHWDELVSVFVRVTTQTTCNALAGAAGGADEPVWAEAFPAGLESVLTTASVRQDSKMAAGAMAVLYSLLRAECAAGAPGPTPRMSALVKSSTLWRLVVNSVVPPAGAAETAVHASEHPAFDWLSFIMEGVVSTGGLVDAHNTLASASMLDLETEEGAGAASGAGGSGKVGNAPDISPDQVVLVSLLDAVLASSSDTRLPNADVALLAGSLRHLAAPASTAASVADLATLPPPEPSVPGALSASYTLATCRLLTGVFANASEDAVPVEGDALRLATAFCSAEIAWLSSLAHAGARGSAQPAVQCIPPGYISGVLQLLGAVTFDSPAAATVLLGVPGALEGVLSHCKLADDQPLQREWALMVVRNVCTASPAAQERIGDLKAEGVAQTPQLQSMGLKPVLDPESGKVTVAVDRGTAGVQGGRSMQDAAKEAVEDMGLVPGADADVADAEPVTQELLAGEGT